MQGQIVKSVSDKWLKYACVSEELEHTEKKAFEGEQLDRSNLLVDG